MEPADRVLKQDAAGRVWTPPERREAVLDEFEKSGLPAAQFAAHVGVKYQTFASWVQKRRKAQDATGTSDCQTPMVPRLETWVEATVEGVGDESEGALIVHLPGGAHVEVSNAAQAKLMSCLLRALGEGAGAC
jgi:hypothetical protein